MAFASPVLLGLGLGFTVVRAFMDIDGLVWVSLGFFYLAVTFLIVGVVGLLATLVSKRQP